MSKGGAPAAQERRAAEQLLRDLPRAKVHVCPGAASPNQRHYYLLDDNNRGCCIYCGVEGYFPSNIMLPGDGRGS